MRASVRGVVIPLPTPFRGDLDVDHEALARYVGWLIGHGIDTVMTTVGTSRFNLLTPDEAKAVNQTVVEAAGGRATTIVANPQFGSTHHAVTFARHARVIGADYFLAYYPERYYGDDNTVEFFSAIASAADGLGILVHETPMRCGFGGPARHYSAAVLERLLQIDGVVGMKEEALDADHSNALVETFSGGAIVIGAGGGMSRYLERDFDRGAAAYLGGIGGFAPAVELAFFSALTGGRRAEAERIVAELERPYFDTVVPWGWHPALKAAISLKGLLPIEERPPMKSLNDDQMTSLRHVLASNGWL